MTKIIQRLGHMSQSCESLIGWDIFRCRDYAVVDKAVYGYTIILAIKGLLFKRFFIKTKTLNES
jgi:hypothetical protein